MTGTALEDVAAAFADRDVDTMIMRAGIDLESRIEVVRHVFTADEITTAYMKDRATGCSGLMPFVHPVLTRLAGHANQKP